MNTRRHGSTSRVETIILAGCLSPADVQKDFPQLIYNRPKVQLVSIPIRATIQTYLPSYLGVPTGLNYDAINVVLRTGFLCGTVTPFTGVEVTSVPIPDITPTSLSRDQVIDAYISLFRDAVARCVNRSRGAVCMGLSGGRDSRHILLELHRQGAAPDLCWSVAIHQDASHAKSLADSLSARHTVIPPSTSLADELEKNRRIAFSSLEHGWIMGCRSVMEPYETVYDGIGGDVLSAGLFLTEQGVRLVQSGRTEEYIRSILHTSMCLNESLLPKDKAIEMLHAELLRYMKLPNPVTAFWFFNRTRRNIAMSAMHLVGRGKTLMTPFLDEDLVAFLLSLPPEMTVDHKLHTDTIARAFPNCTVGYSTHVPPSRAAIRRRSMVALRHLLTNNPEPLMSRRDILPRLAISAAHPARDYSYLALPSAYCAQILRNDARDHAMA